MDKKNKKILIVIAVVSVVMIALFFLKDRTDTTQVQAEQDASIEEKATEVLNENNDLFSDDVDFGDVEIAPLALDTTKAEKL